MVTLIFFKEFSFEPMPNKKIKQFKANVDAVQSVLSNNQKLNGMLCRMLLLVSFSFCLTAVVLIILFKKGFSNILIVIRTIVMIVMIVIDVLDAAVVAGLPQIFCTFFCRGVYVTSSHGESYATSTITWQSLTVHVVINCTPCSIGFMECLTLSQRICVLCFFGSFTKFGKCQCTHPRIATRSSTRTTCFCHWQTIIVISIIVVVLIIHAFFIFHVIINILKPGNRQCCHPTSPTSTHTRRRSNIIISIVIIELANVAAIRFSSKS
mmetsp:Transcript_14653/g.20392  ORF Transcript_14653/g.20392 Transcript_14653/m.20392 type:complete len:266 (+) Transcript_14653:269-1066(+)